MDARIKKIAVIGNGGGGKTTLSRALSKMYRLELTHVDSIQYLPGMQTRNVEETRNILNQISSGDSWIIDGFGPLDVMDRRFQLADRIVFIDFPLWRHYWWCTKRQLKSIWFPRSEIPDGCNEATLSRTVELFKILWRVHTQIKPQLIAVFDRPEIKHKVIAVRSLDHWQRLFNEGVLSSG